jgi:hypothetical protein
MLRPRDQEPLRWVWLWGPLLLFVLLLFFSLRDDTDVTYSRRWWAAYFIPYDEQVGVVELATPLCSAAAVIAGIAALRHRHRLPTRWLQGWMVLVTLACAWLTGEELAWGQNQLGFNAPEWWPIAVTNLHSLTEGDINRWWGPYVVFLSEEGPRLLLELFVLYGGIIRVLLQRGDVKKGDWRIWFWPTYICLPSALLAILARMPERLDWLGYGYANLLFDPGLVNWQSRQELHFALFLFLYLLSLWYRVADGTDRAPTNISGSRQAEPSP